ncbi:MAG: amino acid permease [Phycisphaeraceae bacterium]|nr:amino acid permease [Phycisphaeraceae bacterium]
MKSDPSISGIGELVPDLPRKVGFWGAIAVMVGVVIGSGIFRTPTTIAQNLGDPWMILALWLAAGLIALCGALTFAELAAMMPHSGGIYVFIREGFGSCPAFVFGWTYMLITKPAAAGGIAFIFAEYFNTLTGLQWNPALLTCSALFVLTLINVIGVRESTGFSMVVTALKYSALVGVIALGLFRVVYGGASTVGTLAQSAVEIPLWKGVLVALTLIMWTYDGWSDIGAIAGEIKNPERTLPRVYISGTLAVIGLYLLVNLVYLWFVPLPEMRGSKTIAMTTVERLTGPTGATLIAVVIIISTLGSSHASVMTGARVTFAQARDGLLFRFLGRISPRFETPAVALWVQLALSCLAVTLLKNFESLASSFVFTMWIFYGMGAIALFVLRARRHQHARPFRVPGYPIVPLIFVLASVGMTVLSIVADPGSTLPWIGVLFAGVPVYFVWRWLYPAAHAAV